MFEFKVTGMTCVACSGTIENAMKKEFSTKGMTDVQIALLTHKMTITFEANYFLDKRVTPDMICEEVECVGFDCELLSILEQNQKVVQKSGDESESHASFHMSQDEE